jgi:hypothetical protein
MKKYIGLLSFCLLVSCSAKKAVVAETAVSDKITADKIIEYHYKNKGNFNTLYIKSNVSYKDPNQSQNVTAEIKIKKDEIILISIRVLGITMAKSLITPDKVQYYEKLNSSYFEGNYSALSKLLGTELDFQKVQNLLLGEAIDNLKNGKYNLALEENKYKLTAVSNLDVIKNFYLASDNYLLKKEEISQPSLQRMLQVIYPSRKSSEEFNLPSGIAIEANQKSEKTTININYNSISFNEELSFPYSVPNSYERIFIN